MKNLVSLLCLFLCCQTLLCAPAQPKWLSIQQPDGLVLTYRCLGDEFMHWYETQDAYTLVRNSKGHLEYAQIVEQVLVPSGVLAHDKPVRTPQELRHLADLEPGLVKHSSRVIRAQEKMNDYAMTAPKSSKRLNTGKQRRFVLLVEYADIKFDAHPTYAKGVVEAIDSLLNAKNYTHRGALGSVWKYYYDNSDGQLDLSCDVIGPITLTKPRAYYGGNDPNGQDYRPREMVADALQILEDQGFDFMQYASPETPNAISTFHVFYAGYGEEAANGPEDAIWAHAWSLKSDVTYDGVTLRNYSCSPELRGSTGADISAIGVVAHELGHTFGLFDFYDTDGDANGEGFGLGIVDWGLMGNGNWLNDGMTPPFLSAWERNFLGWHEPKCLDDSSYCKVDLAPMNQSLNSYYFNTSTAGESYYLEVRDQKDWDAFLPGKGLLIYHVDRSEAYLSSWTNNRVNAKPTHECFRIKAPNNDFVGTSPDDAWPMTGKTEFTDESLPSALSWAGQASNKPIRNIQRTSQGHITFEVGTKPTPPQIPQYLVSASATTGGTVSPSSQQVDSNANGTVLIKSNPNFRIEKLVINQTRTLDFNTEISEYNYTFTNVKADSSLKAFFVEIEDPIPSYTITSTATTGGQVNPKQVSVDSGQSVNINIRADAYYKIEKLEINGQRSITFTTDTFSYTYTFNQIRGDSSLKAYFVPVEVQEDEFALSITCGVGGQCTPDGSSMLSAGASQTIVVIANDEYCIDSIIEDQLATYYANCTGYKKYNTQPMTADKTVRVEFRLRKGNSIVSPVSQALNIYPNPCRDILNIEWAQNTSQEMVIFDVHGRLMWRQRVSAELTDLSIDVSGWPSGAYVLRIGTHVQVWVKK